jgi:hypothetical protein
LRIAQGVDGVRQSGYRNRLPFYPYPEMNDIEELQRLNSPAPRPQSLAWDGSSLWMGSLETKRIYEINVSSWAVVREATAPGTPWGMTAMGNEFRVICGETNDDRFIRRYVPSMGFDENFCIPCPENTGSQLGYDGRNLHLSQWYLRKVLTLGADGSVERVINVPHGICGQVFVDGLIYLMTTDDEKSDNYWLTRVDPGTAVPRIEDLARIPFAARALAFDGERFWTNHREKNQIVSFVRPD